MGGASFSARAKSAQGAPSRRCIRVSRPTRLAAFLAVALTMGAHCDAAPDAKLVDKLKTHVDAAYEIVAAHSDKVAAGQLSEPEAKALALKALEAYRYDRVAFVKVMDTDLTMLMHPYARMANGRDQSAARDSRGKPIHQDMLAVAKAGGGVSSYVYSRPDGYEPAEQATYVRLFEPWGWMVSSTLPVPEPDGGRTVDPSKVSASLFRVLAGERQQIQNAVRGQPLPPLLGLNTRHVDYESFVGHYVSRVAEAIEAHGFATAEQTSTSRPKLVDWIARRNALGLLGDMIQFYRRRGDDALAVETCGNTELSVYQRSGGSEGQYTFCASQPAEDRLILRVSFVHGPSADMKLVRINSVFVLEDIEWAIDRQTAEAMWYLSR